MLYELNSDEEDDESDDDTEDVHDHTMQVRLFSK